jgi:hypothetical protein
MLKMKGIDTSNTDAKPLKPFLIPTPDDAGLTYSKDS